MKIFFNPLGPVCFKYVKHVYNNECVTLKLYRVEEGKPWNSRSNTTMQQTNSLNVTFVFSVESLTMIIVRKKTKGLC